MKENVAREAILAVVGVACAIVAGLGFACSGAFAQCRLAELEIPSPPGFGIDVAISNGRAAVSFPDDFVDVYRLDRSTWVHEARITGPADVRFGASVALFGSWLGVGAPGVDDGRGKVYLYEREGDRWLHRETLVSPRPITNRQFGLALEASENRIAILEVSGSALMDLHVFVRVTHDLWAFDSTIRRVPLRYGQPNGAISADGRSVAFARVWTIQGPYETRIYERQGESWIETLRVRTYGRSSIRDDRLAIGTADRANPGVQLYRREGSSWTPTEFLMSPEGAGPGFGDVVTLGESTLLAGSIEELWSFRLEDDGTWSEGTLLVTGLPYVVATAIDEDVAVAVSFDDRLRAWDLAANDCALRCRDGSVNAAERVADTLFLNGEVGDARREISIGIDDPWLLWMLRPPAGGMGRFVVHANLGAPGSSDPVSLPDRVGLACFTPLLTAGASPVAVWNGIGREDRLGASRYFDGTSIQDPAPAPAFLLQLDQGDAVNLPVGTELTLQGVLEDPAAVSTRGFAATNAIVVRVE